jgi:hypothetical protein
MVVFKQEMNAFLDLIVVAIAIWLGLRYLVPFFKRMYGPQFTEGRPDWMILVRGIALFPFIGPLRLLDFLIRRYVEPKAFRD